MNCLHIACMLTDNRGVSKYTNYHDLHIICILVNGQTFTKTLSRNSQNISHLIRHYTNLLLTESCHDKNNKTLE